MTLSVAILGTGVIGLTTASRLQEVLPEVQLTVIGEKNGKETTSYGAAGNFFPDPSPKISKDIPRIRRWFHSSFHHYQNLLFSADAYEIGISLLPFLLFMERTAEELQFLEDFSMNLRAIDDDMIMRMNLSTSYSKGFIFDSFLLESRYYMPYLSNKIVQQNGEIEQRFIHSVHDLSPEFDLIINCTGLGSRQLFNDDKIHAVRGQAIRVTAPWIKHAYMGADYAYIFPTRESVVLGGISQAHNYNTEIDPHDTRWILEHTQKIVPSLKHASIIEEWTGLRPCRDELRLEIDSESLRIPVVHNYGHNTKGIALSYGTAVEAVELAKMALSRSKL